MSRKHPIIAVTGSSGAGTPAVRQAFENIFRREVKVQAAFVEGAGMHNMDRAAFQAAAAARAGNNAFSHFGPEANHFDKIEEMFKSYGETGMCKRRYYVHTKTEADKHNKHFGLTDLKPGVFTPWEDIEAGSELLVYEGLHGLVVDEANNIDVGKYVDLGIGVVPVVNLEWIQKIHRDEAERGYSAEATVDTIMRRLPDYIKYITPQFSRTHINFQRVATVDTSNPFIAREVPTLDESFVIVRFRDPRGVDFPYLLTMIPNSFMSRANTLVVPGGMMGSAMEVILAPIVCGLVENRNNY